PDGPTAMQTMRDAADGLIRTVSEDTLRETQLVFAKLRATARRNGDVPKIYGPEIVDFDSLGDTRERDCFKRVPTGFDLPADTVDALRAAGRKIVAAAAEFRRFVRDHAGAEGRLSGLTGAERFCPGRRSTGERGQ
ncbi:MAG: hypothetical protein ACREIP_02245, partial [Alphaproteobacteria bacterium]